MDKPKKAAALSYDLNDEAPKVIAKGRGVVAQKILEKAQDENIPVYKDEKLVESLTQLEIGEYIPPELYQVVAEILVFIDKLDRMKF